MADITELERTCDHESCRCVAKANSMVVNGNSVFCSIACRYGEGCSHEDCDCGAKAENDARH